MANLIILSQDIRTQDGLYSLNDLYKASGAERRHSPKYWLRDSQTQGLMAELEQDGLASVTIKPRSGTWAGKALVYAYAMWIGPSFYRQVAQAFEPAPPRPSITNTHHRFQALNHIADAMGIEKEMVVLSAHDIMTLVRQLRHYQRQIANMQPNLHWVDESIERVKRAAGRGFGDC